MPFDETKNQFLPQELQEVINIAHAKVTVLRDEAMRLEVFKERETKEIAELELNKETLKDEVSVLTSRKNELEATVNDTEKRLKQAESALDLAIQNKRLVDKQTVEAKEKTDAESRRLSEIVLQFRKVQEDIEIEKDTFKKQVEVFEGRKNRVKELLGSI